MPNPPNFVAGAAGAPARATYDDRDQRRAVDPLAFGDTATQFQTQLIIPTTWLEGFGEVHTVAITATNIWGNSELVAFVTVPEPGKWWIIFAPLAGIPPCSVATAWSALKRSTPSRVGAVESR